MGGRATPWRRAPVVPVRGRHQWRPVLQPTRRKAVPSRLCIRPPATRARAFLARAQRDLRALGGEYIFFTEKGRVVVRFKWSRLPPKQTRFDEEYLVDLNGKQAAIR